MTKPDCTCCRHHKTPAGTNDKGLCVCKRTDETVCEADPNNKGGFRLKKGNRPFPRSCPGFEPREVR
jgi:hypothetical protein